MARFSVCVDIGLLPRFMRLFKALPGMPANHRSSLDHEEMAIVEIGGSPVSQGSGIRSDRLGIGRLLARELSDWSTRL